MRNFFDYQTKDLIRVKSIALLLNEIGLTNRGKKWAKSTVLYLLETETATGIGKKRYKYYICSSQKSGKRSKHFDRIPADKFDEWMMKNISKSIFNKKNN
ncbi:recombinase family protein [Abyssogena phaseoliformis symbiont]|uniref:recombinase family protein n=1 Tax=Abyssogena phaseoliformis symbiont TaxID=596095 RepID=UPI001FD954A1|nr:recombinase family protein [Abyssogena phaseoliformis symbiont]